MRQGCGKAGPPLICPEIQDDFMLPCMICFALFFLQILAFVFVFVFLVLLLRGLVVWLASGTFTRVSQKPHLTLINRPRDSSASQYQTQGRFNLSINEPRLIKKVIRAWRRLEFGENCHLISPHRGCFAAWYQSAIGNATVSMLPAFMDLMIKQKMEVYRFF